MTERQLPEAFLDLAPYLAWALPTERERRSKRATSSMAQIKTFYDGMLARMDAVLPYLDKFPPENPPPDVQQLFLLATALAEIAPAIEMFDEQTALGLDVLRLTSVDIYPARR